MQLLNSQAATYNAHAPYLNRPAEVAHHVQYLSLDAFKEQQKAREGAQSQIRGLDQAIKSLPELVGVAPKLDEVDGKLEEFQAATKEFEELVKVKEKLEDSLKLFPKELTYSDIQLAMASDTLRDQARWDKKQKLEKELAEFVCPACDHHWHAEDPRLKDYADLPKDRPETSLTAAIIQHEQAVNAYQGTRKTLLDGIEAVKEKLEGKGSYNALIGEILKARQKVALYQKDVEAEQRRRDLIAQRDLIFVAEDCSELIRKIETQAVLVAEYERNLSRHLQAKVLLDTIPANIEQKLIDATLGRENWLRYESALRHHLSNLEAWRTKYHKMVALKDECEEWVKVLDAILDLRARIKGYLLPSLNDVGSRLLNMMSKGWLTTAEIDEDFEMRADGKPVHLLSGAGKALTNLALRIGLGQVLTNSVFSVLVLDEADHGVDIEKAPMIAEALKALTGTIAQVIVISHKQGLVADQRIEL